MPKRTVFISSVQGEFQNERRQIADYIRQETKPIASMQIYGGTVFDQVDMAVTFVMSRIDQRVGERIHSTQVDVTPELPAQAVREAIVNAVVHRDYTSTGSVQVMLFKDRLEVWNPGRLPVGMTIERIKGVHRSRPVNPTLANPVYLTGYIEQMGTGTTDIIGRCEKAGLRTPDFIQDEDFTTILWRPEKESNPIGNEHIAHETDHVAGNVAGNVTGKVAGKVKKLILAVGGDTKTREEIMKILLLKGSGNFRDGYLYPALSEGYIAKLYPDAESRTDQAYYLTPKGLELLKELKK